MALKFAFLVAIVLVLLPAIVLCLDDPYKSLGVPKTASQDDIKKAFKTLSKKWHPDKNDNSQESQAKFMEINEAYEILTDETKRRQFEAAKYGTPQRGGGYEGFGGFGYFFQNRKPIFSDTFSLTYDNYDTMVDTSEDLWVIEFYTDRCAPCIENAPIWDQVAKSLSEFIKFGRINADEETALLRHFRIRSIPSVIIVSDSGTHYYKGNIEFNALTEYIKQFQPHSITNINNNNDWARFKSSNNNKPHALLFSKQSSISPLYKYVSSKYSHLYKFAQVTNDRMDELLGQELKVEDRPSILFFSEDFSHPTIVSGPFTKESLIHTLHQHKLIRVVEFQFNNFIPLCGKQSSQLCGIAFTSPGSKYHQKHLSTLRELNNKSKKIKFGWIDGVKFPHFLSSFNLLFKDGDNINGLLIIDGKRRKYAVINDVVELSKIDGVLDKLNGELKFIDVRSLPSLISISSPSIFEGFGGVISAIVQFLVNNIMFVFVMIVFIARLLKS